MSPWVGYVIRVHRKHGSTAFIQPIAMPGRCALLPPIWVLIWSEPRHQCFVAIRSTAAALAMLAAWARLPIRNRRDGLRVVRAALAPICEATAPALQLVLLKQEPAKVMIGVRGSQDHGLCWARIFLCIWAKL